MNWPAIKKITGEADDYFLTRSLFQKALGFIYFMAFLGVISQFIPLLGEDGLLPVGQFISNVSFWKSPSLFYLFPKDSAFLLFGSIGLALSVLATLGLSEKLGAKFSACLWLTLWLIYLSFVNIGQGFYGFGWESLLLETGFLAIFLGDSKSKPSVLTIFLLRWVLFRIMFGAGLIKLRGDACWKELTCLNYHYETQPMPNPLSWYFHHLPVWFDKVGVLYNHFVELIVPFFYFAPQPAAAIAGTLTIIFHGFLGVSGNYAWLGALTLILAIPTFSDNVIKKFIHFHRPKLLEPSASRKASLLALGVVFGILSIFPIGNMLSAGQIMNTSFNRLHLVNTYGAFGSVTKKRFEIVLEGTSDAKVNTNTVWKEYEFKGKPGDITKVPPQVAPYHLRLDWLMWFEGIGAEARYSSGKYVYSPWFIHLVAKLLTGDKASLGLLKYNPFPDDPPNFIRASLYHYQFTSPEEKNKTKTIWKREYKGPYLPPLSLETPELINTLQKLGW